MSRHPRNVVSILVDCAMPPGYRVPGALLPVRKAYPARALLNSRFITNSHDPALQTLIVLLGISAAG